MTREGSKHEFKGGFMHFDKNVYEKHVSSLLRSELAHCECEMNRETVTSGWFIAWSSLLLPVSVGISSIGVVIGARRLYLAKQKLRIVQEEVKRRNLPLYQRRKRDIIVPLATRTTTLATDGIIHVLCFAGTIVPIAHAFADHGLKTVNDAIQNPGVFTAEFGSGAECPAKQVVRLGGQDVATGLSHCADFINGSSIAQQVVMTPSNATKAAVASTLHQTLATNGSEQAAVGMVIGMAIAGAQLSPGGHAYAADPRLDVAAARALESQVVQGLIHDIELAFVFSDTECNPSSQVISTKLLQEGCWHFNNPLAKSKCNFCHHGIDPAKETYYHCCQCHAGRVQSVGDHMDICENCVARLGCGCRGRSDHELHVLGTLTDAAMDEQSGIEDQSGVAVEDSVEPGPTRSKWWNVHQKH